MWNLQIYDTEVTDAGVNSLATTFRLRHLYLGGPRITNRCLEALARMSTLEHLALWDTQITDAGIEAFKKSAPQCNVDRQ